MPRASDVMAFLHLMFAWFIIERRKFISVFTNIFILLNKKLRHILLCAMLSFAPEWLLQW